MGYRAEDNAATVGTGSRSSRGVIASCVRRSLEFADAMGMRSVGFPALATGFGGFPMRELRDESAVRVFREALG